MSVNVAEVFGQDVFNEAVMKERLPEVTYKQMVKLMNEGGEVTLELADIVAKAMKEWAIEKGATHYTHIFQPYIVSIGAEKHDSFADIPKGGKIENCFSGKDLMMGEPDASSFPSGGLRATCAARGYTAWDVGSPAYVKDGILCIPTAFCSYTGESLDTKTPLLKACDAVSKAGVRFVKMFGNTDAKRVSSYVGPEQEYFIVNREKYLERPDLIYAGRTLFGAPAPKGQEMEDQYFGPLKTKIADFMADVDEQLWKLGITVKTQHNEVAPGQHEIAPIFAPADAALDSNFLVMDVLKSTATKHGLACLLHEKPFAGVNGSGKHNNWSLGTDNGVNLFKPGKEPNKNLQFLCVLACLMEAVNKHALLLRAAASNTGNDHRLGANEAPPAIISVFLGEQLEDVVKQLVETGDATHSIQGGKLLTGVSTLPDLDKDATDRNRTSPFAFTGNKFEFRMVGSADSIASPNTTLNAIVAEAFCEAADLLEKADDFDIAVHDLIKKYLTEHQRIIFNGNGYSEEWVEEAARRGLPNIKSMVEASETLTTEKSIKLFEKFGIFTKAELESREEVLYETYSKTINIEALTMVDMAKKQYIPAVMEYTKTLADTVLAVKSAGADATVQTTALKSISEKLAEAQAAETSLEDKLAEAAGIEDPKKLAFFYKDVVHTAMDDLRAPVDALEMMVDKKVWPVPTYGDLIFEV